MRKWPGERACVVSTVAFTRMKPASCTKSTTSSAASTAVPQYKGTDVASIDHRTGAIIRLFNPRQDRWADHFRFDGAMIEPVSRIGSATVRLLRLNAPERLAERRLLRRSGL